MSSLLNVPLRATKSLVPPTFGQESKATLMLALPLIAGQLGQMLMGVIDTIMIGRLGVTELGAATLVNTLLMMPLVLGMGLLTSISVRVSQAHGAESPADAEEALRHGTWIALAFGALTVLVTWAALPFLGWLNQPTDVTAQSPVLLMLVSVSLIPALFSIALKNHADALNHPWPPFTILMGGVALNAGLNWLWIYGKWGFPAMGVEGAGWATLVARILTAGAMLLWLTRSTIMRKWMPLQWFKRCRASAFKHLLAIGFPASLHMLTEVSAFAVSSLLIGTLGTVALAAHQVAITCAGMAFMIPLGISMATTVRVGEIVGARESGRLHSVLLGSWMFAIGTMLFTMVLFLVYGHHIAGEFVKDQAVIAVASKLLIVAGLFQLFDGIQIVSTGALRGVNDVRIPAWFAFGAYWIIAVPLGAFLGLHLLWGPTGMWTGLAIGLAIASVLLSIRAWRLLDLRTALHVETSL